MQLCTQLQRAASAWTAGDWQLAVGELAKAPYEAAMSAPVRAEAHSESEHWQCRSGSRGPANCAQGLPC